MTYLGTRPPLIGEVSEYELHHRARLAIKPGITGMWQVTVQPDLRTYVVGTMDLSLSFEESYIGYSGSRSAEPGV